MEDVRAGGKPSRPGAGERPRAPRTAIRPPLGSNVAVISLTAGFATTWYLLWSPVVPLLLALGGASAGAIAIAFAATNLGNALAQYIGGRLADHFGVRAVIGLTGIALGVVWLLMAAASSRWQGLALFFFLGNVLFGIQMTAFITVVSDSVSAGERTRAFAYYWFWSSVSLVVGPIAGSFLALPRLAPATYLALTGFVYLAVGVVRLVTLRDPQPALRRRPPPFALARALDAAAGNGRRRQLLILTSGVTLTFALTVNGPFMALATHLVDHVAVRFVDLLFGVGALGALVSSAVASRHGHVRAVLIGALGVHALSAAALVLRLPGIALVAAYLFVFAGFQVATVAFSAIRVELAGTEDVGEVLGATSAGAGVVAFAGLLLGGLLGSEASLGLAAAAALATAAWVLLRLSPERPPDVALLRAEASAAAEPATPSAGSPG